MRSSNNAQLENTAQIRTGKILRLLRKNRRLSIEAVAAEAGITSAALSRIETGLVMQPELKTLEKIHDVFTGEKIDNVFTSEELPFTEWAPVLEGFGYSSYKGLPSPSDIRQATKTWATPLRMFPLPAYLVDYAQRVHAWNDVALRFLGISNDSQELNNLTLYDLAFDCRFQSAFEIKARDEFILHMVTILKSEAVPLMAEEWCIKCINDAKSKYPEMREIWDNIPDENLMSSPVRTMGPITLAFDSANIVQFNLLGTDLVSDHRFRVIQYIPLNEETAQKCFEHFNLSCSR